MKKQLFKILSLFCIVLLVLNGCMSTVRLNIDNYSNEESYIYEINERSKKNNFTLLLRNGEKIHGRKLYLTRDSLYIFDKTNLANHDSETFHHLSFDSASVKYSNNEVEKIIFKNRVAGGFTGLVSGIVIGYLNGYVIAYLLVDKDDEEAEMGILILGNIIGIGGAVIGGVTGLTIGIVTGSRKTYEFESELEYKE